MRRFTDTLKWDDSWFRNLPGCHKLVFLYVVDRCNNAGFWEVDEDAICWHTKIEPKHLEGAWKGLDRGIKGASGWIWVRRFLHHQKNEPLNALNPAHKQIISLVVEQRERFKNCQEFQEFVGAYKGLLSPIGTGKGNGTGKKRESPEREKLAGEIYDCYPSKIARPEAIKAICKAISRGTSPMVLMERTKAFAAARNGDVDYCPNPATWFNQERFNDDPETWKPKQNGKHPKQKEAAPKGAAYRVWDSSGAPT